jgi:hypothetical protein
MNLLIYSGQVDRDESELLQATRRHNVQLVRTPEKLVSRLSQPPGDKDASIIILLVSGMAELEKLLESRECLSSRPLILILPEEEKSLIPMGCRLRARYMGFRGGAFEDVAAVIARIQTKIAGTKNVNLQAKEERL